jgi:D-lactate dehydrogenase
MRVAVFGTKAYDRQFLEAANTSHSHDLVYFDPNLSNLTARLADGFPGVCIFVNDKADAPTLETLAAGGTQLLALRCAGFNQVDLAAAERLEITVVRVPAYSPYSVAEHAVGLILMLNRKLHRAYNRVRDDNFALEGLLGFDLHGSTVGIVGTGKIGVCFAQIMKGFGCNLVAYDVFQNSACLEMGVTYLDLPDLLKCADIISLHCPLTPDTYHLINPQTLAHLKPGSMLINTSRGALIDTPAVITAIKSGQVGYLGIDVYEQEENLFFQDLSDTVIQDDTFQLLQSFPNVVITAHQAFFTRNALTNIADTTLTNITAFATGQICENRVLLPKG